MSSYLDYAIRKEDLEFNPQPEWEEVTMLDNHFGHHVYGVRFINGEIREKKDVVFKPFSSSYKGITIISEKKYKETWLSKIIKKLWKK